MDENVFIDTKLPSVPRVGETVYLSEEEQNKLEKKAKSSLDIARTYQNWFYGNSFGCENLKEKHLEDLMFDSAITVCAVLYNTNSDIVHIELNK